MKYNSSNKPLVCMQTQSKCYKETRIMKVLGILWHSTGANNKNLKRYVQPSDVKPSEDTYSKSEWLTILGKNSYNNDINHNANAGIGLNCWIGALADGTVTTVQTMPWTFRPWGCGVAYKGGPSCNDGWIQFEICEDNLKDEAYFNKVYKEACEITAYLCKMFDIDPNGYQTINGVKIPNILCHKDSNTLGFGSNHGDVMHWFPKYGKSMETARKDVTALLKEDAASNPVKTYKVVTPLNRYSSASDAKAQKNAKSNKLDTGTYYLYNKYPDGYNGMYNVTTDKTGVTGGCWINPKENVLAESAEEQLYRVRKSKDDSKSQKGAYKILANAKKACQKAGEGYHVFDKDNNIVYSYVEEETIQTEKSQETEVQNPTETLIPDTTDTQVGQEKPVEPEQPTESEEVVEPETPEVPDEQEHDESEAPKAEEGSTTTDEPVVEEDTPTTEESTEEDKAVISRILKGLEKLIQLIINLFTKGE